MKPEIINKMNLAMAAPEVQEIIDNRDEVLMRFSPLFQLDTVSTLGKDVFQQFLSFKYNKHWSNLERQKNRLCVDMGVLRKTLCVLVDEARPINLRVDETLRLHGMGIGTLSAILLVAYPDKYGVWNSTSEKALRHLGLWPSAQRGATNGEKYDSVNRVLLDLADKLNIDLWTLDALWWRVGFDNPSAVMKNTLGTNETDNGRTLDAKEKSVWKIMNSVLQTVKNANGQTEQTTIKNKELLMSALQLEEHIRELLNTQGDKCAITGLPFQFDGDGNNANMRPSLDRIDSDGHYGASNVQLVCRFINFWKRDTPDEEFRRLIQVVRENKGADIIHSAE